MKKVISLFIVVIILVTNVTVVYALPDNTDLTLYTAEHIYRFDIGYDETNFMVDNSVKENASFYQYGYNVGSYIYSGYSILSSYEKELYDEFVACLKNGELSVKIDYSPALNADVFNSIDWTALLQAIVLDHPEFFFMTGMGRSWAKYSNGTIAYIILDALSTSYYDSNVLLYTAEQIDLCNIELENAVKSIDIDSSNRYNFVKSLHNYLCNNIVYINNQLRCHDVYGALVEGNAVCQGYANSFKMICDYYKIPCVCLTGTANGGPHMWNAVQMDDGKWYLIDVTWDDQGSNGIYTDFFLIGLNTKDYWFTGEAFSSSHVSDGNPYLPVLSYATDKYSETEHNTAFKATFNSLVKDGRYLVRSFLDAKDSYIYYNGIYVDASALTTNGSFSVPSGENGGVEEWTLVLLGDCTGDGECNSLDYSDTVNKVLSGKVVESAYDMAADIDCDGYLDVLDLAVIQRITSGINTNIIIE